MIATARSSSISSIRSNWPGALEVMLCAAAQDRASGESLPTAPQRSIIERASIVLFGRRIPSRNLFGRKRVLQIAPRSSLACWDDFEDMCIDTAGLQRRPEYNNRAGRALYDPISVHLNADR